MPSTRRIVCFGVALVVNIMTLSYLWPLKGNKQTVEPSPEARRHLHNGVHIDRTTPLIFIGGIPRSGTTLMRSLLDAHPEVRCGEETRVIPSLLESRMKWTNTDRKVMKLKDAGISGELLDLSVSKFILEIITRHGERAPRFCNKDPFTAIHTVYLSHLFPNAKFLLLIRDGRAVSHSVITRKVAVKGFSSTNFTQCLQAWNALMETMYKQCTEVGPGTCMSVHYEQLILHPQDSMEKILAFLNLPWNDRVLHHDRFINKPGGVSVSKTEPSTDQVIKPINLEALTVWASAVPDQVRRDMINIAPMLEKLGYDPLAYPPNYGTPDHMVINNTQQIQNGRLFREKKTFDLEGK